MGLVLLVLLLVLIFAGLGFIVHLLWIVAVIALVVWLVGWLFRAVEGGGRRRWYGRY
jgi:hypothetical protein